MDEPVLGRHIRAFDAVASTNETLKELLEEEVPEGTVVTAKRQVSGRGRHGRAWHSPAGGLYCSVLLEPPERDAAPIALLAGIPAVKTLRHHGVLAYLRWPNDVHFMERKIAGILGEGVHRRDRFYAIVGVGFNTNIPLTDFPESLRGGVTSLQHEEGLVANEAFLAYFLQQFDLLYRRYRSGTRDALFRDYRGLCTTIGRRVHAEVQGAKVIGTAAEVTPRGSLILLDEAGQRHEVVDASLRYV
jgi:BirA family biotin operon repressor/biotin-[acetyl-CoA-carboxylase] ligase